MLGFFCWLVLIFVFLTSWFLLLKSYKFSAVSLISVILLWHRKYLRDADRQVLAQQAFVLTVKVLEDTLDDLTQVRQQCI